MSLIQTRTADQRLILITSPKITSGNQNVDRLSVILDNTWEYEDLTVKARFHTEYDDGYIVEMSADGGCFICNVPDEVEALPGLLYIGIYGEANGGIVKTTNEIHITIAPGTELVGAVLTSLLPEIISIMRRTISSSISTDTSEDEALEILENNLSTLHDLQSAYTQLVNFVNQYQNTSFSDIDYNSIGYVCRYMWDIGVQLSNAQGDVRQLTAALERYIASINSDSEIIFDGQIDLIIDEVGSELDALIAELEAERQTTAAVKAVYENFYLGGAS